MRLPELNEIAKGVDYKIEFKGLDHNMYVGEGKFYDMQNLCATNYPVMTPRAARGFVQTLNAAGGIFARGKLAWVNGGKLYYDGRQVYSGLTSGEKTFVGMGAWIIIFPDGVRYNTSTGETDLLAATYNQTASATIRLCRQDGTDYNNVTASDAAPTNPTSGKYWLDTSKDVHVLKVYSDGAWVTIPTTYVRIQATGAGMPFKTGDAVEISGTGIIDGSHDVIGRTDDSIVIIGVIDQGKTVASGISIKRSIPQMDFVVELNNRLWGCSSAKHEIYCCKLGDPTNWRDYGTNAADAWAVTVGSAGDFTGAVSFGGSVLFFKEDMLHKVYGTKPSNFQITDKPLRGVQKGCHRSIDVVNESLIYKSRDCVCVYDEGNPMDVSEGLGHRHFSDAAAGSCGDRYYISMRDEDGEWHLFVFNEAKGMWHREDATHARQFAELNGQLYMLTDEGKLIAVKGREEAGATLEGDFDWWAETGDMLMEQGDNKYVSRIQVRAQIDRGATLKIEMMYDSDGHWVQIYSRSGAGRKLSFTVPIIPMRCDHVRMRISGHGRSAVYAISKQLEKGSEI